MVLQGSTSVLIVPGGFLWFYKVPSWFLIVPGRFFMAFKGWFFMVSSGLSWFQVGFHGFSRFQFVFFMVLCQLL